MTKKEKIDALRKTINFVQSKAFCQENYADGLCLVPERLSNINSKQFYYLNILLSALKKQKRVHPTWGYVWKAGVKAPRIKWLREQIKKLEAK